MIHFNLLDYCTEWASAVQRVCLKDCTGKQWWAELLTGLYTEKEAGGGGGGGGKMGFFRS